MNENVLFSTLPFLEATRQNETMNPLCFEMRQSMSLSPARSTSEVFQTGSFGIFKTTINKRKTRANGGWIQQHSIAQKAESRPLE